MFTQLNPEIANPGRWFRRASLAAHGLLLAWLLHAPEPMLLNPISVALGHNGKSVTRLYWDSKSVDDSTHSSSDSATEKYRHQRLSQAKLLWKAPAQLARLAPQNPLARAEKEDNSQTQTLSALGHAQRAGRPSLRNLDSWPAVRRRSSSGTPCNHLRPCDVSLGTSRLGRQRCGRDHHRRTRGDHRQDCPAEPRPQARRKSSDRARQLALPPRHAQWRAHLFEAGRHLPLPRPRLEKLLGGADAFARPPILVVLIFGAFRTAHDCGRRYVVLLPI